MTYEELLVQARNNLGDTCNACPICNGKACKGTIPGPGAKENGDGAIRNYAAWQKIRLNMDTLCENKPVDTIAELFGKTFQYPFFSGPVGSISFQYKGKYEEKQNDLYYNDVLIDACKDAGIAHFVGDGPNHDVVKAGALAVAKAGGMGGAMIKPWGEDMLWDKLEQIKEGHPFAISMDVDGAGLPVLKATGDGFKTVEELREIIKRAEAPFIVKGIMTLAGARKALEAGASGIVVSNHGGRAQEQCPATAEVLEEIAGEMKGKMTILVDGGIRSGADMFKALALGADGVLICRPFVTAFYGGEKEGVKLYVNKIGEELRDTMAMCGASSLKEITRDMVRI